MIGTPAATLAIGFTRGRSGRIFIHRLWTENTRICRCEGADGLDRGIWQKQGVLEPVREQGLLAEDFHAGSRGRQAGAVGGVKAVAAVASYEHALLSCGRMAWWAGSGRLVLVTVDGLICASTLAGEPHECCPGPPMSGHLTFRSGILTLVL